MKKCFVKERGIINAVWPLFFLISVKIFSKIFLVNRKTLWSRLLQMVLLNKLHLSEDY